MTVDMGGACSCHQLPMNTYWVDHGRFLAGEYPGAPNRNEAAYKLRILLKAGISRFIDLTEPYEGLAPYAPIAAEEASRLGTPFQHSRHSIVDLDVPRSPENTAEILDVIDEAISAGKTVYVHCWGGVGRTGTVVGCWLVRHGRTGEQALDQIATWWTGMEKAYRTPRSPEMPRQREYVRNWSEPVAGGPSE
ncbi:protein-tyrosine phosphatase family protein [Candidatus Poriferisodalis sp.]|uniref:protein-tyrosine phosphatase family protein n=1 Tax=Candidatus Poriferisodalis sp. TaxID=3101277 RepID=UPI003AF5C0BD